MSAAAIGGARISVVGIGADGWDGLPERSRAAIRAADEVVGSARQLASLPELVPPRRAWPSPLAPLLEEILTRADGHVCVLASGDPMQHGIGATITGRLGPDAVASGRVQVHPHPSAGSLALARLGWSGDGVELVSAVGRPPAAVMRLAQPGRRLIVYVSGTRGAVDLADLLARSGFGASRLWLCEQLGAETERVTPIAAAQLAGRTGPVHAPLTSVAVEVATDPDARFAPTIAGLPDDAYAHDGQLTKRHVRAATLAALAPAPGQLLWDLGAGSGSISIEWLRAEPTARAIAVERDPVRAARAKENATALGVPQLAVLVADAGAALGDLRGTDGADASAGPDGLRHSDRPDAIFVGGGLSTGVLEAAWDALAPGGRLVANAVTMEAERLLVDAWRAHGGELVRLGVAHAAPIGAFTTWREALAIVQWAVHRTHPDPPASAAT